MKVSYATRARSRDVWRAVSTGVAMVAALGVIAFVPPRAVSSGPFAHLAGENVPRLHAGASLNAFGASHEVTLRFTLPNTVVEFPLEVSGDPSSLAYEWVSARDSVPASPATPLDGAEFVAPSAPGFYHLVVVRGVERDTIGEPTLAVMVPFAEKLGTRLNGYTIGTYLAERLRGRDHPAGFLEVHESDLGLKVSRHLRLGDFVTHDAQANVWPKYVALNPRLLDKLELVLTAIGARAHLAQPVDDTASSVAFDVHSGFRTPAHNRNVWHSARDSRHQYGDAADVAIDADGDGRVTVRDERLVARAVDQVEAAHPDLVGGLGLYVSRHYRTPYVHIDARGKRSRWTG